VQLASLAENVNQWEAFNPEGSHAPGPLPNARLDSRTRNTVYNLGVITGCLQGDLPGNLNEVLGSS
jgi:hypothetical protein